MSLTRFVTIAALAAWIAAMLDATSWSEHRVDRATNESSFDVQIRKQRHWAWRPIENPAPPVVKNVERPFDPLDLFILAKLEAAGIPPAPPADKAVLIRRLHFDLIGLPPAPEEIGAFVSDDSPDAIADLVDRLLASPHFGERWARHWLDLVRYAETYGHEFDYEIPHAWRYRDYVIRALNEDVRYDQFVAEHFAGDLIANPRRNANDGTNESIIGTGYWWLAQGTHAPVDVRQDEVDRVENQIDVFSKTFLGMTVACARCHDHKFDAISTRDYYALAGYLQSSRRQFAFLDPHGRIAASRERAEAAYMAANNAFRVANPLGDLNSGNSTDRIVQTISLPINSPYELFENFDAPSSFENWFVTGHAFGDAPIQAGDWNPATNGRRAYEAGMAHSGRLGDRYQGVLRSKTFEIKRPYIHYRFAGERATVRVIIDGYTLDTSNALLFKGMTFEVDTGGEFRWHVQGNDLGRYIGHRAHIEIKDEGDGWIAVDEIRFADTADVAKTPSYKSDASSRSDPTTDDLNAKLANAAKEIRSINDALPTPTRVLAMADGSGEDEFVMIRGDHRNRGELAPRCFLTALASEDRPQSFRSSGRLDLAGRVLDDNNPLTSRAIVNRVWGHLFGRGIARSPDNLGVLGESPTHPLLLDYLATWLRTEGQWSIKRLIRKIVLSRAYQMSSIDGAPNVESRDPTNNLFHRMPVRRLEGEAIRDAMLAVSGRLDRKHYGPSVPVHLTEFMTGRGRPKDSGPLDGDGRRSIYIEVRRNFLSPMMLAFDTPVPHSTVGARNASNVPAQALILMNDPFVAEQARYWAKRSVTREQTPEARLKHLYLAALGRPPTLRETTRSIDFLIRQANERGAAGDAWRNDEAAWSDMCHILFNAKEFILIR